MQPVTKRRPDRKRGHFFKVEKLSEAGRELVHALLAVGATYETIVKELRRKTGESIGDSSVARYRAAKWLEPESKTQAVRRTHQLLGELLLIAGEIRDAIRALGARQLRVVGGASEPGKPTVGKKEKGDDS